MKNLKLLLLFAILAVFAFVNLFVKNASGDQMNERPEMLNGQQDQLTGRNFTAHFIQVLLYLIIL